MKNTYFADSFFHFRAFAAQNLNDDALRLLFEHIFDSADHSGARSRIFEQRVVPDHNCLVRSAFDLDEAEIFFAGHRSFPVEDSDDWVAALHICRSHVCSSSMRIFIRRSNVRAIRTSYAVKSCEPLNSDEVLSHFSREKNWGYYEEMQSIYCKQSINQSINHCT